MKLHRFLPGRGSAWAWRHQDDTGTLAPRKPTSSRAPADRKALARSRLCNGKDLLPNLGGACPRREAATRPFGALLGARTVGRPRDSAGCRLYLDLWANILSHPRWDRASDLSSPDRRLCAVFFVSVLKSSIQAGGYFENERLGIFDTFRITGRVGDRRLRKRGRSGRI
jgi:hypothetical protein